MAVGAYTTAILSVNHGVHELRDDPARRPRRGRSRLPLRVPGAAPRGRLPRAGDLRAGRDRARPRPAVRHVHGRSGRHAAPPAHEPDLEDDPRDLALLRHLGDRGRPVRGGRLLRCAGRRAGPCAASARTSSPPSPRASASPATRRLPSACRRSMPASPDRSLAILNFFVSPLRVPDRPLDPAADRAGGRGVGLAARRPRRRGVRRVHPARGRQRPRAGDRLRCRSSASRSRISTRRPRASRRFSTAPSSC